MGAWGHGLLESDSALDVVDTVTGLALADLHRLGRAGPSEKNALLASGCLGVIALFGRDSFDATSEIPLDDSPTSASYIRTAVAALDTALATYHPPLAPFVADLLGTPLSRAPSTKHEGGKISVQLSVDGVDEAWARRLAKAALRPPAAREYAKKVLEAAIEQANIDFLTELAGALHVAVTLRHWVRTPAIIRRAWRERCAEAVASGDDFEQALARSCRRALKQLVVSTSP